MPATMPTSAPPPVDFLTAMAEASDPVVAKADERNMDLVAMQKRLRAFSAQVNKQVQRLEQENRISLALRRQRGW
jgi:hypothetical protein